MWEWVDLPWKPSFNGSPLCQCVAMQQIDKVKHEGQILPNIDLSKQSPILCCPDVTTVSVHYSKSNSMWKQLYHTVNIVATVCAGFIFCVLLEIQSCLTSAEFNILKMGNIKLKWKYFDFNSHINEVIAQMLYNAVQPFWFWSSVFVLSTLWGSSVWDWVASMGEIADCSQLNTPYFTLPYSGTNNKKKQK